MIVKRDRVRKSSGWTEGVANVETDCAADLMARKDAVRFDLKVDPRRPNEADRFAGTASGVAGSLVFFVFIDFDEVTLIDFGYKQRMVQGTLLAMRIPRLSSLWWTSMSGRGGWRGKAGR